MADEFVNQRLSVYEPRQIDVVCRRCTRHAALATMKLKAKYGDPTLGELARLVAADGQPPCNLAAMGGGCSAQPVEPRFEEWATLTDARLGNWVGWLSCQRRMASLKPTSSCPGEFMVDVHSLLMLLDWSTPLAKLPMKLTCPECQSQRVSIRWEQRTPPDLRPVEQRRSAGMGRGGLRVIGKAS